MDSITWLIMFALYMLPTIIALVEHNKDSTPIFFLNLFFGWTVVGWILTLVWALKKHNTSNDKKVVRKVVALRIDLENADVIAALISLGYSKAEATEAVSHITNFNGLSLEEKIKMALQ